MTEGIIELNSMEIDYVAGGPIPLIAAAAFVSGARWGAGVVLAAYAAYKGLS